MTGREGPRSECRVERGKYGRAAEGEPDTDKSRKPQAAVKGPLYLSTYPRSNLTTLGICSPDKNNSDLLLTSSLLFNPAISHGNNFLFLFHYAHYTLPLRGQQTITLALSFSPVHAGASAFTKGSRLPDR